jgi:(1->4)-alpha-D-glucan 1-alpha-D-glucosylmutase
MADAQQRHPTTMLATSTHDAKRSEDVRMRVAVLSEMPDAWRKAVREWADRNERHRTGDLPDRNAEYLVYQTLAGAWPIGEDRLLAYVEKAAREAKRFTAWTRQDETYETALQNFCQGILNDKAFVKSLETFLSPVVRAGRINSLAQTLVKLTAPGVPDLYQGSEVWDSSLVDPDNRRPVDFDRRRRLLKDLPGLTPEEAMKRMDEGLPKLWVIAKALDVRKNEPETFGAEASYEPCTASGRHADRIVAYLRSGRVATVVPRLTLGLNDWGDTAVALPKGLWRNAMTGQELSGGRIAAADLFESFPVALLAAET